VVTMAAWGMALGERCFWVVWNVVVGVEVAVWLEERTSETKWR
jgi:hypothetical protein